MAVTKVATGTQATIDHALQHAVTVVVEDGGGSGVIVNRFVNGAPVSCVLTAAHVVTPRPDGTFGPVKVIAHQRRSGRVVGKLEADCEVVNRDPRYDTALLKVKADYFLALPGVEFYLGEEVPGPGREIVHVGSYLGLPGADSAAVGRVAQVGRDNKSPGKEGVRDQTDITILPGSSGGGVYLADTGEYMGMLVAGIRPTSVGFIVPIRELREWAIKNNLVWILNPRALPAESL